MYKNICFIFVMLILGGISMASANNYDPTYYQKDTDTKTLKDSVLTVPAGEAFKTLVTMPLSSENLSLGQNINLALNADFYYNGKLIAPIGSMVNGTVLDVSKAKHGTVNGKLLMRFTQIVTPYGLQIPISAVVKTEDKKGILYGGEKMTYTNDTKISNSSNYTNISSLETTVGSGGGILKGLWDKGIDVSIPANSVIELVLTQPITVNPALNQNDF